MFYGDDLDDGARNIIPGTS